MKKEELVKEEIVITEEEQKVLDNIRSDKKATESFVSEYNELCKKYKRHLVVDINSSLNNLQLTIGTLK